jgi:hypothetical protein
MESPIGLCKPNSSTRATTAGSRIVSFQTGRAVTTASSFMTRELRRGNTPPILRSHHLLTVGGARWGSPRFPPRGRPGVGRVPWRGAHGPDRRRSIGTHPRRVRCGPDVDEAIGTNDRTTSDADR